jgi:hypothetical protein
VDGSPAREADAFDLISGRTIDDYPLTTLKWNQSVNNFMVYGIADIPVGN